MDSKARLYEATVKRLASLGNLEAIHTINLIEQMNDPNYSDNLMDLLQSAIVASGNALISNENEYTTDCRSQLLEIQRIVANCLALIR